MELSISCKVLTYGGGLIANSELLADTGTLIPFQIFLESVATRQMNAYNGGGGLWNDGYRAINMANIIISFT